MSYLTNLSDEELINRFSKRPDPIFSEIYNRYWKKLYVVAYNRLRDEEEAREVVQEVFLEIWKRRENLIITNQLNTYLSAALKYRIINKMASIHRQRLLKTGFAHYQPSYANNIHHYLYEKELIAQIEQNVRELPKKCRLVFQLSRNDGKNIREIANELHISEKTVEAHLTKALKHLRNTIKVSLPYLLFLIHH